MEKQFKFKKRLFFNGILSIFTCICYFSAYISPQNYWIAGFLALAIPLCIIFNFIFLLHWFLLKSFNVFLPLAAILIGFNFLQSTLNFHWTKEEIPTKSLKVLSYNVQVFNVYSHLQDKDSNSSKNMINWVAENDADIKCLQEVYNEEDSKVFATVKRISKKGKYKKFLTPVTSNNRFKVGFFGLAIFSRFPIINSGEVKFTVNSSNTAIYADILRGEDTIRVYNVHFQSMSIDEARIVKAEQYEEAKKTYQDLFTRLKNGFQNRAWQVNMLEKHIQSCHYPVILCGDFNDTPYSYTYTRIKKNLNNAFERAGNGFGFTFNGKLFFLRIDNQFVSDFFEVHSFKTHRNIPYSDHFPTTAIYTNK